MASKEEKWTCATKLVGLGISSNDEIEKKEEKEYLDDIHRIYEEPRKDRHDSDLPPPRA